MLNRFMRRPLNWLRPSSCFHVLSLSILFAGSMFVWTNTARARTQETVILQYQDKQAVVPLSDLQHLIETGDASTALQDYFALIPLEIGATREILNTRIYDEGIPLSSRSIEFLTLQLTESLGDPLGRERRDEMFTALRESFSDDREITLFEVVENYPNPSTRLDLARLNRLHSDLTLFVERIEPILNVISELLPDLVCDCGFETVTDETSPMDSLVQADDIVLTSAVAIESNDSTAGKECKVIDVTQKQIEYDRAIAQLKFFIQSSTIPLSESDESVEPSTPSVAQALVNQVPEMVEMVENDRASWASNPIAENIIIAFGPIRPSFAVKDLATFIETGAVPNGWRFYFNVAGIDAEEFRTALTQEVDVDFMFMDQWLNNILGEYLLFQVGTIIHTPSGDANIQALRSALVISALNDGKISLFEFLRNYPAQAVVIEGINLARFGSNLQRRGVVGTTTAKLEDLLLELQADVADEICDCEEN